LRKRKKKKQTLLGASNIYGLKILGPLGITWGSNELFFQFSDVASLASISQEGLSIKW
jgi:hypothetical protein